MYPCVTVIFLISSAIPVSGLFSPDGIRTTQNGNSQAAFDLQRDGNQTGTDTGLALTENERQGLLRIREEEKLARDVYQEMHDVWGDPAFANISQAESRHISAVAGLLARYRIPDPVNDDSRGQFPSATFQELYESLVKKGSSSRQEALQVGLKIEEMDIADLRQASQRTENPEILRVFENLQRGSRNHLRAFAQRLQEAGGNYNPTELTRIEFEQIAGSRPERGGRGRGPGQGRGSGNRRLH